MCDYSDLGGREMEEQSMFTRRPTMNVDSSVPCAGVLDLKQNKRTEQSIYLSASRLQMQYCNQLTAPAFPIMIYYSFEL